MVSSVSISADAGMHLHYGWSAGVGIAWTHFVSTWGISFAVFVFWGEVRGDPSLFLFFLHELFEGDLMYKTSMSQATWAEGGKCNMLRFFLSLLLLLLPARLLPLPADPAFSAPALLYYVQRLQERRPN